MARGQLILIEGLDRSGKSTQVEILAKKLSGQAFKFPDRETVIGAIIDKYLRDSSFQLPDETAHLLFSANRWEVVAKLEETLNKGITVVLDRYIYSGIAYTLAKNSKSDITINNIEWLYSPDKGLPKPDITLFLTLNMQELGSRKGWGEERYENEQFQLKVKQCFEKVFEMPGHEPKIIDVSGKSIDQTTELIWDVLERYQATSLTTKEIIRFT